MAGCSVGLTDKNGTLIAKEWMIESTSARLREVLRPYRCSGGHDHADSMGGNRLWRTAIYTPMLAALIAEALLVPQ